MKKVLFLVNHDIVVYNFRLELVERLQQKNYKVLISSPYGKRIEYLKRCGAKYIETIIDRRGMNPIKDIGLLLFYLRLLKKEKPDMVLTYTIKPNIYGGLAAELSKTPYMANITGLGSAVEGKGILQKLVIFLYRLAFMKAKCVFFQNQDNLSFFKKNKITVCRQKLLPGSGVNLEHFSLLPYPCSEYLHFAFIGRIMREKGIEEYLEAACSIRERYKNVSFHICGFCEEQYEDILKQYEENKLIQYHGMVDDIRNILRMIHCVVLPSHHEGMSNVLLEAAACGRPIITTNRSGCREVVNNEKSGYLVEPGNSRELIEKIEKFIHYSQKEKMGKEGRKLVEKQFDRRIVVDAYEKEMERQEKCVGSMEL